MCIRDRLEDGNAPAVFVVRAGKAARATLKLGYDDGPWVEAVSYTHLDVYKRQALARAVLGQRIAQIGFRPVSYTHLDVYKRQKRGKM